MKLNEEKTKYIIFNQTIKYKFATRHTHREGTLIETITQTKHLGKIISSDLTWHENTLMLVRKAYGRMTILRKLYCFSVPISDLIQIYIIYIRCYLEQSCVVWHSSLTEEDSTKLERVQKVALRIILKENYLNYENALEKTGLENLKERREDLCMKFAQSCLKKPFTDSMFPLNKTEYHNDTSRHREKFVVQNASTERLKKSAIPHMQRLLNSQKDI